MLKHFSLRELADLVDMQPRTVRSYIEKGLLPGPGAVGRYAHYGPHHLKRLQAIKVFRDIDGLTLDEIRRRLLTLGDDEIEEIADRLKRWRIPREREGAAELSSALSYVRSVKAERSTGREKLRTRAPAPLDQLSESTEHEALPPAHVSPPSIPLDPGRMRSVRLDEDAHVRDLLDRVANAAGGTVRIPRRASARPTLQISVTPDVDLLVRGVSDPDRIARLERVADYLRYILLGSSGDDPA